MLTQLSDQQENRAFDMISDDHSRINDVSY
jgi:hypothetical protein